MNLSFAGCGFLGIYHVGVAVCFKKYAPHLLLEKVSGASAGALAAACLLCDLPLGNMTSDFFRVVNEARRHSLGPFSPSFNIQNCLLEGLERHLPYDAHKRVNGRLHVSLTRVYDGKNVIISQFNSRDDVLQALLCACFIPGFSGILPPRFRGVRYMDGAFSDNLPILDENTVTVSPFCGESDICPRDQSSQLFHVNWANTSIEISKQNINRFARILFPSKPEVLSNMCQQGFDDALQYLHRNNLITCTKCVAVQSTFIVSETISHTTQDYDPECTECTKHRKDALIGNMPETVVNVFQTYIDSANKGIASWLFKHKGAKIIRALSLPATVPVDIIYATITKIIYSAPTLSTTISEITKFFLYELRGIVRERMRARADSKQTKRCNLPKAEAGGNLQQTSERFPSRQSIYDAQTKVKDYLNGHNHAGDFDAFDHILQVTNQQESVYAYYYMDETNKVKVTEIFDMTGDNAVNNFNERIQNQQNVQIENEFNVPLRDNIYINTEDNLLDEIEPMWPGIENSDDVSSDYSEPEVDQAIHMTSTYDNNTNFNSLQNTQMVQSTQTTQTDNNKNRSFIV